MTRNQLANSAAKSLSGDPMFTVDSGGSITPTEQQIVLQGRTILIQAASESSPAPAPYSGYVCAWWNNACRCSSVVTDLGSEKHMKIRGTPYHVASNAPEHDYTIYTTQSESGPGPTSPPAGAPIPFTTNGQLHVGH
jgi:hypothetical protein